MVPDKQSFDFNRKFVNSKIVVDIIQHTLSSQEDLKL